MSLNTIIISRGPKGEDGGAGGGDLSRTDIDTLAKLNGIVADATLISTNDARLSDERTPTAHTIASHDTTVTGAELNAIKTKVDGVEDGATSDQSDAEIETAYNNQVGKVSGPEITAGTEVSVRRFSPADIKSFIDTFAGGGGDLSQTDIDSLAKLNGILTDATLIDTGDSRLSNARTPTTHATSHTDGTDDIQSATNAHKGLATAAHITAIEANTSARHDAVTVSDSAEIDLTLTGQQISASIVLGSIDETKLDASVNASLDLADSASQPGHTHVASDVTDFDAEVSNNTDVAANTAARHDAVSIAPSGSRDYVTLSGNQQLTLHPVDLTADVSGDLPITEGGTGASDAATARTNLGVSSTPVEDYLVDDGIHTLTSSGGVCTPDASNGVSQKFPLTEAVTDFNTPTNLDDGGSMLIQVLQNASQFTLDLDTSWKIMGGSDPTDIGSLAAGEYAWLSISRYGTDYLISITTQTG
jgi:hypothetical protein